MTKKVIDLEAQTVTFDFENGETTTFDLSKVSSEIVTRLALHGASQKIGDSYANTKKAVEGTDISEQEYAYGEATATIAQLYAGDFNVRTAGVGVVSDLAIAVAEVSGKTVNEVVGMLADATKEQKKALRAHPAIKAVLERIKLEKQTRRAAAAEANAGSGPSLMDLLG